MSQFVGYLVAGYPSRDESIRVIRDCCEAGLDILELGFPASDASLDGEIIRTAQKQVDSSLARDLDYWREVRRAVSVPIWLMGYRRDLMADDIWLRLAEERLYDALVIPDLPEAEASELRSRLKPFGISLVGFINSMQSLEETDRVLREADLIYHQLYCGPTGVAHTDDSYLSLLRYVRAHTCAKIYAGFGISTAARVRELLEHGYDGTIIGSAIVHHLLESESRALSFIREIRDTIREENGAAAGGRAGV